MGNREPENSRPTRKAALLQLLPLAAIAANAQFNEIGKAFVGHYYQMFDASIEQRSTLQSMYQDASMLSFEDEQFMGMQAIMTKLTTLQFQTVAHQPTTTDCQPTLNNGIQVFVTGKLAVPLLLPLQPPTPTLTLRYPALPAPRP